MKKRTPFRGPFSSFILFEFFLYKPLERTQAKAFMFFKKIESCLYYDESRVLGNQDPYRV